MYSLLFFIFFVIALLLHYVSLLIGLFVANIITIIIVVVVIGRTHSRKREINDRMHVFFRQELEHMQTGKYPSYYMALRDGRELQGLCVASDPERTVLTEMLDELKQNWFTFKSILSEKYARHYCTVVSRGIVFAHLCCTIYLNIIIFLCYRHFDPSNKC